MKLLITGASRGIGKAICEHRLQIGDSVLGLARNPLDVSENSNYTPVELDLATVRDDTLFNALAKEHQDIDGIIACAGFGVFGELEQCSAKSIEDIFRVNVISQIHLIKSFLPHMKKRASGNIIFIGSESALRGGRKGSLYCATKFALRGFAQSLRYECSRANITVSIINPGMVRTSFFDDLDFAPGDEPEHAITSQQIADAVDYILSTEPNMVVEEICLQPLKFVHKKQS